MTDGEKLKVYVDAARVLRSQRDEAIHRLARFKSEILAVVIVAVLAAIEIYFRIGPG